MTRSLSFVVYSAAAPQGSKRHLGNGVMIESSKRVKPFRHDVRQTALDRRPQDWDQEGPFKIVVDFHYARPKSHLTSKGALTKRAPLFPVSRSVGDLDKLLRATFDSLTGVLIDDDSSIVEVHARKLYADEPATIIHLHHV